MDKKAEWIRKQAEKGKYAVRDNYGVLLAIFSGEDEESRAARRRKTAARELEGMELHYKRRKRRRKA